MFWRRRSLLTGGTGKVVGENEQAILFRRVAQVGRWSLGRIFVCSSSKGASANKTHANLPDHPVGWKLGVFRVYRRFQEHGHVVASALGRTRYLGVQERRSGRNDSNGWKRINPKLGFSRKQCSASFKGISTQKPSRRAAL